MLLLNGRVQKDRFWEFESIEDQFKYRNAVMRTYMKRKFPQTPYALFLYSGRAGMYQHSQSEGAAWHRR